MTQAFNLSQLANNVNTSGLLNAAAGLYNQTPVANGGTGVATITSGAVLIGAGTSAVTNVPAATSGNVLTANGTAWVSQVASGGTPIVRIYSSPSPWTKPSTLKAVKVTLVGGGASGGGAGGTPPGTGGFGGSGGILFGYAQAPAIPGPVTATVGAAGAGVGGGATGNPGGTTSFGAVFSTTGGTGGGGGSTSTPGANGANGGSTAITSTATTASISVNTPTGTPQIVQGWGTKGVSNAVGTGYGAGGGASSGSSGGPAGTGGFIIVEEFY